MMNPKRTPETDVLDLYSSGSIRFSGAEDALYERHLTFDHVVALENATTRDKFEAVARSVRDVVSQRWIKTEQTYHARNVKRVYYVSLEFLMGRALANNVTNMKLDPLLGPLCEKYKIDPLAIADEEPDAGLGNGGLGRLAACFLDSMATLAIPGMGSGLRYEYGIFRQTLRDGWQHEVPDYWLARPDPWEVRRPNESVEVHLASSFRIQNGSLQPILGHPSTLIGIPHDRPVIGYGGRTINTLRLWSAASPYYFDFHQFSGGDFVGALAETLGAQTLTRVLYPDDSTAQGKGLRFLQQYFMVACTLADAIRRFRAAGNPWSALPDKVAIQMNDTHPTLAVPELMRILLDDAKLQWDQAWECTKRTLAYTNHTLLPEALEKWPLPWFEALLPRHLEIVYEINRRFLDDVRRRFPGDDARVARVSLVEESEQQKVRMANLGIVGSHSTNGVAAIHSDLLRKSVVPDFAELFPERFNNKTNGVTQRRFLLLANPALANVISGTIGDGWITDLAELGKLKPLADDPSFRAAVRKAKREAKARFADWLRASTGQVVDPASVFDTQIKRIHEYKRQLLNALHIVVLYQRLRADSGHAVLPRTFFFGGKAAPAYRFAKLVIKFINNLAGTIDGDPVVGGRLKVVFVPDYCVGGGASDSRERDLRADLDRRLRGERHRQHEVHDERGAHDRHARRRDHRDGRSCGRGELLPVRPERGGSGAQPRALSAAVALRQRTRDAHCPRSHREQSFQPARTRRVHADPRRAASPRRPLPASRRPEELRRGAHACGGALRERGRLDAQGDPQHRGIGKIFERPDDRGICQRYLACRSLPGRIAANRRGRE